jgi:hypothetical protein
MSEKITPPADDDVDPLAPFEDGDGEEDLSHLLPKDDVFEGDEYDESDLSRLTDEERAALEESDDEEQDDEDEEADEQAPASATEVAAAADAAPADDGEGADALPPQPEVDVDAAKAIIENAEAERKKLFEKYEDGELTGEEYLNAQAEIAAREADARADIKLFNAWEASVEQISTARFEAYRDSFNAAATEYLTAHPGLVDEAHVNAYDQHVKDILTNDALRSKLDHVGILTLAHKRYLMEAEALGIKAPPLEAAAKAETPEPAATEKKPVAPPPPTKKPELPRTIQNMPASDVGRVRDDRWGQLQDRLERANAAEAEAIMASLSPEEREAFASMDV